jgi:CDP-diacylglycerol--serine O-phosphatidyltransferase
MSPVKLLRQHLPNILTLCNLALGFLAVLMALENQLQFACWLILLAALFDFLDGFAAKLLKAESELGKQLDSLADIISFGMAPAALVYMLMDYGLKNGFPSAGITEAGVLERIFLYSPMLLLLFAALRLAAYNIQQDTSGFLGLATPAVALFFAGLGMGVISHPDAPLTTLLLKPNNLLIMILILSMLMVIRIPMFSLKFTGSGWKGNEIRYLFLAVSLILLIILQEIALPVIILVYLLLSLLILLGKTRIR